MLNGFAPNYSDIKGNVFENKLHPEIKFLTVLKLRYFLNLHIYDYENYSFLNKDLNVELILDSRNF